MSKEQVLCPDIVPKIVLYSRYPGNYSDPFVTLRQCVSVTLLISVDQLRSRPWVSSSRRQHEAQHSSDDACIIPLEKKDNVAVKFEEDKHQVR